MGENKITGIPKVGRIVIENIMDQCKLVERDLADELTTTGIILIDGRKLKVNIRMVLIITPSVLKYETNFSYNATKNIVELDKGIVDSLLLNRNSFIGELDSHMWLMIGYFTGKKNVPFLISHYENINYSNYSVIEADEMAKYFPNGVPNVNPSAN